MNTEVPHTARIWNYWLGGKDNFAADRAVGDQVQQFLPDIVTSARADRAFLKRAVRHLVADAGIRQFLDVGTGLPTADNTHEVAQSIAPESRIVYADNDPLVLAHARALLTSTGDGVTDYIDADARDTGTILGAARRTLDFDRPVSASAAAQWNKTATPPITLRGKAAMLRWFEGLELVDPGVVTCTKWRPEPGDPAAGTDVYQFCGLARKP